MSKQTALQKAIEQLKEIIKNSNYALYALGCGDAIEILHSLLPYEREVIEQTFQDADDDRVAYENGNGVKYLNPNHYFTKTFTAQP